MPPLRLSNVLLLILFFWLAVLPVKKVFADEGNGEEKATPTPTSNDSADEEIRDPQSNEENSGDSTEVPEPPPTAKPAHRKSRAPQQKRKYFVPDTDRVDAGVFHVSLAVGGNFYMEPAIDPTTFVPNGNYYKDFGFQAGVNFDYDYAELSQNIPLELRGFLGYKFVLNSVHVFTFDGVVRWMSRVSEKTEFGVGIGGSAAIWYREVTDSSPQEEVLFLPSFIAEAGFDFNPMMVELKWLINQLGADNTRMGFELYFGIRL